MDGLSTFTLTFRVGNDAFLNSDGSVNRAAVAEVIRNEADRVEKGRYDSQTYQTVFDHNGNDVGRGRLK